MTHFKTRTQTHPFSSKFHKQRLFFLPYFQPSFMALYILPILLVLSLSGTIIQTHLTSFLKHYLISFFFFLGGVWGFNVANYLQKLNYKSYWSNSFLKLYEIHEILNSKLIISILKPLKGLIPIITWCV